MTGFERPQHVKQWELSATAAELWSDCPQAFSFQRELGIEEVASRPLRVGRLMAQTVEGYLTHCFELGVATDVTEIESIARRVFEKDGAGLGLDALEEVIRICSYYVQGAVLDLDRLAGVELWLPPDGVAPLVIGGRQVRGKVDQLLFDDEGRLAIVKDQKTNWHVWTEREAREAMQAKFYPILVFHSFPDVEEVQVEFEFVRFPGSIRPVRYSRAEAELERQNIEALTLQMQKPGKRPATPGAHCSFCGYVDLCPRFKSARDNQVFVVPRTTAEAQQLLGDVAVLEAGLERRRAALRSYTDTAGPVAANGVRFGQFRSRTPRVNPHRFMAWAQEHGVADPLEYFEISPIELRRLARKRKSLEELFEYEEKFRSDLRRGEGDEIEEVTA